MTTEYRVIWEIDLNAKSPKDAARKALAIQRDPMALATVFAVFNPKGRRFQIDLETEDPQAGKTRQSTTPD